MTTPSVAESGAKTQPRAQNSENFRKKRMTREERLKGDVDFYTQMTHSLQNAKRPDGKKLNTGQKAIIAFALSRCQKSDFCYRDKLLRDFVAHHTDAAGDARYKMKTAVRYLRDSLNFGFMLDATGTRGQDYIIASVSCAKMRDTKAKLQGELHAEEDYNADLRRVRAEKAAQDAADRAELLAFARAAKAAPAAEPEKEVPAAEPANSAAAAENFDDSADYFAANAQNNDAKPAKFRKKSCKTLHRIGKNLRRFPSKTGGEYSSKSSLESPSEFKKETTPESVRPCVDEESRAYEDQEREGVVFSFDSFCGEEKEWVEWDGKYGDSDVPEYVETFEDVSDEELNIVVLSDTDTEPVVPPGPDDDDDDPFADAGFVALRAAACRAAAARKNDPFADDDDVLKDDVLPVPTISTATAVAGPAPRKSAAASSQLIDELSREFQLPVSEIDSELTRVTPGCSQVMFDLVLAEAQKVYSTRRESKKPITDPWPWFVGTVRNTAGIALTAARENGGKQPSGIYYQMSPERQREVFSLTATHPRQAEFDALLDRQGRLQTVMSKLCPKHTGVFDDLNVAKKARIKSDAFTSWLREVEKTG